MINFRQRSATFQRTVVHATLLDDVGTFWQITDVAFKKYKVTRSNTHPIFVDETISR